MALIRGGTIKQSRPPWSKLLGGRLNETLGSCVVVIFPCLGAVSKSRENVLPFFFSFSFSYFFPFFSMLDPREGSQGPADADDRLGGIRSK